jgi:tetratricopeptide (TPR) repeat protein
LRAFTLCDERVAIARLQAETLEVDASVEERLQLGAAWIEAARYEDGVAVLLPLAQQEGADSQAAWLAGFALVHAGRYAQALPMLEGARHHAKGPDAHSLIGLCKLNLSDTDGAIAELEAGAALSPDHPPLLTILSRAYTAAARKEDAARVSLRVQEVYRELSERERHMTRLSSRVADLREAWQNEEFAKVEKLLEEDWTDAPPTLLSELAQLRVLLLERSGQGRGANRAPPGPEDLTP